MPWHKTKPPIEPRRAEVYAGKAESLEGAKSTASEASVTTYSKRDHWHTRQQLPLNRLKKRRSNKRSAPTKDYTSQVRVMTGMSISFFWLAPMTGELQKAAHKPLRPTRGRNWYGINCHDDGARLITKVASSQLRPTRGEAGQINYSPWWWGMTGYSKGHRRPCAWGKGNNGCIDEQPWWKRLESEKTLLQSSQTWGKGNINKEGENDAWGDGEDMV